MQSLIIRNADINDLDAVTKLESRCFPIAEAADRKAFECRLRNYSECFWVLEKDDNILCMINGMTVNRKDLCDEMYEGTELYAPNGKWLMLFGVATLPEYQHKGLASQLMDYVIETRKQKHFGIVLTCKENLIQFYEKFGYFNEGISNSAHGNAVWYQMRLKF
nr:N-acetyltransferase [Ruminococcus sp.]